jgi:hypothetical protein
MCSADHEVRTVGVEAEMRAGDTGPGIRSLQYVVAVPSVGKSLVSSPGKPDLLF